MGFRVGLAMEKGGEDKGKARGTGPLVDVLFLINDEGLIRLRATEIAAARLMPRRCRPVGRAIETRGGHCAVGALVRAGHRPAGTYYVAARILFCCSRSSSLRGVCVFSDSLTAVSRRMCPTLR